MVEVLVSLLIFGVAIVGILRGLADALAVQSDLSFRMRASMLAGNILEEIRYTGELEDGEESGQFEDADAAFSWRSTIVSNPDDPRLKEVKAVVSWSAGGRAMEYELTTLMHEDLEP